MIILEPDNVIAVTQTWLEKVVIGLNLCPFAKAVYVKKQIRYTVSAAKTQDELHAALIIELQQLVAANPAEFDTTLLIHPEVLIDFIDYNDFLDIADDALHATNLVGVIQIASFHPQYQFAGTVPDSIDNYTNRSPFPMLHLLRENSITRAVATFSDTAAIFDNNIKTLRQLGYAGWEKLNN